MVAIARAWASLAYCCLEVHDRDTSASIDVSTAARLRK
jgi:hypothetical protein